MPKKNFSKRNASISKKKFNFSKNKRKKSQSLKKLIKNQNSKYNFKINKKIITDSDDEENENEQNLKNQRYPKKDYLSYESLSTEKTYNVPYKKKLRYPKTKKNYLNQK